MSKADMVQECVSNVIRGLDPAIPSTAANLARLRRGVGKHLSDAPETWAMIIPLLPDELTDLSRDAPRETEAESAIFSAVTLYAAHQQGNSQSVNRRGSSFGAALGQLRTVSNEVAISRRFDAMITSTDLNELVYHARGMIQLMRSSDRNIGFDYLVFAKALYNYQFPEGRRSVILRWGQDYYGIKKE